MPESPAAPGHHGASDAHAAALDAFLAYSEASNTETDVLALARHAVEVLRVRDPSAMVGYYAPSGGLWALRAWSDNVPADLLPALQRGLPADTPLFREALERREAIFMDGWGPLRERTERTAAYTTASSVPIMAGGVVYGFLTVALPHGLAWGDRDRALVRAVARGLTLALERAEGARVLQAHNEELAARSSAMEGFAELTRDLGLLEDPYALIRRAQTFALDLLPDGYAVYLEPEGDRWVLKAQVGDPRSAALQAAMQAGLPARDATNLQLVADERAAQFLAVYANEHLATVTEHLAATALLPLLVGGRARGVFALGLLQQRDWSRTDVAMLETVVRSLGLAIERAEQARRLDEERRALAAFTAFSEAAGVETDATLLAREAMRVLAARFNDRNAFAYYERDEDRWACRVWSADLSGDPAFQAVLQGGMPTSVALYAEAQRTREAVFEDPGGDLTATHPPLAGLGALAAYPLVLDGEVRAMLAVALHGAERWLERDRSLIRAVGRSLTLTLERAHHARTLAAQRDALRERSFALEAANEELEAFTYSVSHDLKTPLRHITSFAQLAAQHNADPERLKQYLRIVGQAADRMNGLIEAMLQLSRSTRRDLRQDDVDLAALVRQSQLDLAPHWRDRNFTWRVRPMGVVRGDRDTLQQVMTNLLSNAVKFTQPRATAEVDVWLEEREREWAVFVQDNGVGYDARYQNKLFRMFQRLHRQDEFEGTGVGLANVRRIISRHGGQVTGVSRAPRGATFSFTLPKQLG